MCNDNLSVILYGSFERQPSLPGLLAGNDLPFKLFSRVQINALGICDMAPGTDYVQVILLARFAYGVVVCDPEGMRLRGLKLVQNLSILISSLG